MANSARFKAGSCRGAFFSSSVSGAGLGGTVAFQARSSSGRRSEKATRRAIDFRSLWPLGAVRFRRAAAEQRARFPVGPGGLGLALVAHRIDGFEDVAPIDAT